MKYPLVSVIIPFYSEKEWLSKALESVIMQDYSNYEVLVINDGSKENINSLMKEYKNVKFIYKDNGGPASARNLGIRKSKGKYVAFLDSDDIWLPGKLNHQIEYMEKEDSIWSQHSYIKFYDKTDKKNEIVDTSNLFGNVYYDLFVSFKAQTSCFVIKRDILINENIFFPEDKRYGQDIYFFIEIAKKYHLDHVDGNLSLFRIRGENAGFRSDVQLNHKSFLFNDFMRKKCVGNHFSPSIKLGYKLSYINSNLAKKIQINKIKNTKMKNVIYNLLYALPYVLIKNGKIRQ